jgi:hypothetical protein
VNSFIKEKGTKKAELRKFNLFQLVTHIHNVQQKNEIKRLNTICGLLKKKMEWSTYVEERWMREMAKVSGFPGCEKQNDDIWHVSPSMNMSSFETVDITPGVIPTCTCKFYKATRIPCCHICSVFSRIEGRNLFSVENLHPRWRLKNHPLFLVAKKKLGANIDEEVFEIVPAIEEDNIVDLNSRILVPNSADQRFEALNEQFQRVGIQASKKEEWSKQLMLQLVQFENNIKTEGAFNWSGSFNWNWCTCCTRKSTHKASNKARKSRS